MKKYMLNKQRKFDIKIFFRYKNIAILMLGYFFMNHPIYTVSGKKRCHLIFCRNFAES